jgi:hypothetical protein
VSIVARARLELVQEMCRAVVDTCSCNMPGKGLTFGEGLNAAMENNEILQKVNAAFHE